jgi:hypothetical protein
MHYKLSRGIIVKTENAAKPERQASSFLKAILQKLPHVDASFDYGCGKLRYWKLIQSRTNTLALVDSEIQLSRQQLLLGAKTSIRKLIVQSNRSSALSETEFSELHMQFDRGFCINVLSVIPLFAARRHVLETIRSRLKKNGTCLFVVQYRNSDFTRMKAMSNARPWRDGFLIDSLRGWSFYGLIPPDRLCSLVQKAGFAIKEVRLNEGSVYLWATPEPK